MLRTENIPVLFRQGKTLAFVESNDEDAGFWGFDNGDLAEGFRRRYGGSVGV